MSNQLDSSGIDSFRYFNDYKGNREDYYYCFTHRNVDANKNLRSRTVTYKILSKLLNFFNYFETFMRKPKIKLVTNYKWANRLCLCGNY